MIPKKVRVRRTCPCQARALRPSWTPFLFSIWKRAGEVLLPCLMRELLWQLLHHGRAAHAE